MALVEATGPLRMARPVSPSLLAQRAAHDIYQSTGGSMSSSTPALPTTLLDLTPVQKVFKSGTAVMVNEDFKSDNDDDDDTAVLLSRGQRGVIIRLDDEGDALIQFEDHDEEQWVFHVNFPRLDQLASQDLGAEASMADMHSDLGITSIIKRELSLPQLNIQGSPTAPSRPLALATAESSPNGKVASQKGGITLTLDASAVARAGALMMLPKRPPKTVTPVDHLAEVRLKRELNSLMARCANFKHGVAGQDSENQSLCAARRLRGMDVLYMGGAGGGKEAEIGQKKMKRTGSIMRRRSSVSGISAEARKMREMLGAVKLFANLDKSNPGLITVLAEAAKLTTVKRGTVLFRQGDPPANAFVVCTGKVGVYIFDSGGWGSPNASPSASPRSPKAWTSPRGSASPTRPGRVRRGESNVSPATSPRDQMSPKKGKSQRQPTPRGKKMNQEGRAETFEGFSSYGPNSVLGDQVNVLEHGSLFGEKAFDSNAARNATIKCETDVEVMVIPEKTYKSGMKQVVKQKKWMAQHLPACDVDYISTNHPSAFFVVKEFPQGHHLLFEGVKAPERALFAVYKGKLELRRYRRATDNPAYVLTNRPMQKASWETRCPPPLPVADGTFSLAHSRASTRPGTRQSGRSSSGLGGTRPNSRMSGRPSATTSGRNSFVMPSLRNEMDGFGGSDATDGAAVDVDRSHDQVTVEILEEGACFCTNSFFPFPEVEAFSVVVASQTCRVMCASEGDVQAMPGRFLSAVRKRLLEEMTNRTAFVSKLDLETHVGLSVGMDGSPSSQMSGDPISPSRTSVKDSSRGEMSPGGPSPAARSERRKPSDASSAAGGRDSIVASMASNAIVEEDEESAARSVAGSEAPLAVRDRGRGKFCEAVNTVLSRGDKI
jgi:CRP-like cAMP-binding protein